MGTFILFILKWAFGLILLFSAYKLLLSKETFYRFNRIALLGILVLSALLPFYEMRVASTPLIESAQRFQRQIEQTDAFPFGAEASAHQSSATDQPSATQLASLRPFVQQASPQVISQHINWVNLLIALYLLSILFFSVMWLRSTFRMAYFLFFHCCLRKFQGFRLAVHSKKMNPFSWFRIIAISEDDLDKDKHVYLLHEIAHIRSGHCWDLLFIQLCALVNPAAWLILREMKLLHEYEADQYALRNHINPKTYQLLIIKKSVGAEAYALANNFNQLFIKKRITMMLKKKTNPWAKLRVLIALPIIGVAVAVFARPELQTQIASTFGEAVVSELPKSVFVSDVAPALAPAPAKVAAVASTTPAPEKVAAQLEGMWILTQSVSAKGEVVDWKETSAKYKRYKYIEKNRFLVVEMVLLQDSEPKVVPHTIGSYEVLSDSLIKEDGSESSFKMLDANKFVMTWNGNVETWERATISDDLKNYIIKETEAWKSNQQKLKSIITKDNVFAK